MDYSFPSFLLSSSLILHRARTVRNGLWLAFNSRSLLLSIRLPVGSLSLFLSVSVFFSLRGEVALCLHAPRHRYAFVIIVSRFPLFRVPRRNNFILPAGCARVHALFIVGLADYAKAQRVYFEMRRLSRITLRMTDKCGLGFF